MHVNIGVRSQESEDGYLTKCIKIYTFQERAQERDQCKDDLTEGRTDTQCKPDVLSHPSSVRILIYYAPVWPTHVPL